MLALYLDMNADGTGSNPEGTMTTETLSCAREWIRTDPQSIREDVQRLGLDGATEYQLGLMADRRQSGDDCWTLEDTPEHHAVMREALQELEEENPDV